MRILGIDPGFERLGIAILEKNTGDKASSAQGYGRPQRERVVFSECFKTSSKIPFSERLLMLGEEVRKVIKEYKPEALGIETLFFQNNQKTAIDVAESRGVVIYEAERAGLKIFEYSPQQIKSAVAGHGKADKTQVMKMVKILVSLDKDKKSDDEMDAIAVALTTFASARF